MTNQGDRAAVALERLEFSFMRSFWLIDLLLSMVSSDKSSSYEVMWVLCLFSLP